MVPRQFIASVEKGVRAQLERGVLAGYPAVDVRVTLVDGKAHSVDAVDIDVADESVGSTLADLRGRRGQVHGTEPSEHEGRTVIHAEIPALELSRYPIDLRSVSHGTGTFTRRFARYDYLPPQLVKALVD